MLRRLFCAALLCALAAPLARAAEAPALAPLHWLLGEWQGVGTFSERSNVINKRFAYELGGAVLVERTLDMFPPTGGEPEFETHQDLVVYHPGGGGLSAKGFYNEGFVNHYAVSVSAAGDTITLETTAVENAPAGMRARIRYWRLTEDRAGGSFELAWPGKDYAPIESLELKRIR